MVRNWLSAVEGRIASTGMGYPNPNPNPYPYPPPPYPGTPQRSAADMTVSIITMVFIVLIGALAAFMGLFSLAFLDYCPPETCSVDGAVTAVMTTLAIAALVALIGMVVTIVRLTQRKPAWPFAVGTLGLCVAVLFGGVLAYTAAVGG